MNWMMEKMEQTDKLEELRKWIILNSDSTAALENDTDIFQERRVDSLRILGLIEEIRRVSTRDLKPEDFQFEKMRTLSLLQLHFL
jgi:hypothetical protein